MTVLAIGDNITDYYVDRRMLFPGGNSVNVAVSVARAGGRSACLGMVGDDARGQQLVDALVDEGVGVERLRRQPGETPLVMVRHSAGERSFGGRVGRLAPFDPDRGDLQYAAGFPVVHSSFCAGVEEAVPSLAAVSRVSFDFNTHLADEYAQALVDKVWFAQFSAQDLSAEECFDLIGWAHSRGARWILVTRGAAGALLSDGRRTIAAGAVAVEPVDTLGAGDACIGRVLHGLQTGEHPRRCLSAGMRAAARACADWGAFGHGLPVGNFGDDPAVGRLGR